MHAIHMSHCNRKSMLLLHVNVTRAGTSILLLHVTVTRAAMTWLWCITILRESMSKDKQNPEWYQNTSGKTCGTNLVRALMICMLFFTLAQNNNGMLLTAGQLADANRQC